VNRRMRVRTYGGVGGREGNNPAYPIAVAFAMPLDELVASSPLRPHSGLQRVYSLLGPSDHSLCSALWKRLQSGD